MKTRTVNINVASAASLIAEATGSLAQLLALIQSEAQKASGVTARGISGETTGARVRGSRAEGQRRASARNEMVCDDCGAWSDDEQFCGDCLAKRARKRGGSTRGATTSRERVNARRASAVPSILIPNGETDGRVRPPSALFDAGDGRRFDYIILVMPDGAEHELSLVRDGRPAKFPSAWLCGSAGQTAEFHAIDSGVYQVNITGEGQRAGSTRPASRERVNARTADPRVTRALDAAFASRGSEGQRTRTTRRERVNTRGSHANADNGQTCAVSDCEDNTAQGWNMCRAHLAEQGYYVTKAGKEITEAQYNAQVKFAADAATRRENERKAAASGVDVHAREGQRVTPRYVSDTGESTRTPDGKAARVSHTNATDKIAQMRAAKARMDAEKAAEKASGGSLRGRSGGLRTLPAARVRR